MQRSHSDELTSPSAASTPEVDHQPAADSRSPQNPEQSRRRFLAIITEGGVMNVRQVGSITPHNAHYASLGNGSSTAERPLILLQSLHESSVHWRNRNHQCSINRAGGGTRHRSH